VRGVEGMGRENKEIARCCFLLLDYRIRGCLEFEGVGMSSSSLRLLSDRVSMSGNGGESGLLHFFDFFYCI
jgi:hypothetical protein